MPRIPLTLRRCMLLPMAGALASSVGVQAAELTFDLKIEHGQVAQNMRLIRVKAARRGQAALGHGPAIDPASARL